MTQIKLPPINPGRFNPYEWRKGHNSGKYNEETNINEIQSIVRLYDIEQIKLSTAYEDGGIDTLWLSLERAIARG